MNELANVGTLDFQAISKTYEVDGRPLNVLSDIGLRVEPGEFVTIVGASGCGKSTLLRLVVGLDTQYEGNILLDGQRIAGPGPERSMVFQDHRLFPWLSVEGNILLGLDSSGFPSAEKSRRVAEHIKLVGLEGFEKAYPHQLSGGMAQRAAIARALVSRPRILLLDEPLGALDSLTRAYLQDELLRIWSEERVTVVMVTHDVEEAVYLSDKIAVMEPTPGRIRDLIPIDLSHPRDRASADFIRARARILKGLGRIGEEPQNNLDQQDVAPRRTPAQVRVAGAFTAALGVQR
jgi:ABC-type nitrate/sulfonate/bicarbonate transport system ATPase subunit